MLGAEKGTAGAEGSRAGHQRWPIPCPDIQLSFAGLKLNSHPTLVKARVEPDRPQRSQCQGPTGGTRPQSQETAVGTEPEGLLVNSFAGQNKRRK